jgi:hypothetical protein
VASLAVEIGRDQGRGLVAIYKDGPGFDVVALDSTGRERPDWAAAFRRRLLRAQPADTLTSEREWSDMIRQLGVRLDPARRLYALAAIVVQRG